LTAKYAEYLFTLDDPRDAVMSFNRDIVTLPMLSDFVFEVLSESKFALLDENRCKCPSTKGITAEPLVQKEAAVLSSVHFTLIVSAFVAFHPFLPSDSMLSKSTMAIFRS